MAIAVRDTGAGIAENVLPRIFDPFFSTKPAHEGAGLGLSICRDLVRSNGSEIQVASTPGEGTTFTVWLPEAESEDRKGAVMKARILVVDNDADMVALLRRHLEVEGWAVTAVTGR